MFALCLCARTDSDDCEPERQLKQFTPPCRLRALSLWRRQQQAAAAARGWFSERTRVRCYCLCDVLSSFAFAGCLCARALSLALCARFTRLSGGGGGRRSGAWSWGLAPAVSVFAMRVSFNERTRSPMFVHTRSRGENQPFAHGCAHAPGPALRT